MGSSDEDIPLMQRNQGVFFNKTNPVIAGSDDDDSPLPSWLGQPKPSGKGNTTLIDSDSDSDDVKEVISPVKLISPSKQPPKPQEEDIGTAAAITATATATDAGVKKPTPASTKKPTPAKKKTPTPAKQNTKTDPTTNGAGPSQIPGAITAPARPAVGGLPVSFSCIPVVIPDRIPQIKVLLELESTDELHGATDLSGDSGAIGRVLVSNISGGASGSGTQQQQQLQIDLKGVLYNATVVPCPMTMAIVNIGPTEAKIESLFSEYVQLREDARFSNEMGINAFGGLLGEDDEDEHYEGGEGEEEEGAAGAVGGGKKKVAAKGKATAGGAKRGAGGAAKKGAGSAARKPRASGVKKSKPAARGKGKAKK